MNCRKTMITRPVGALILMASLCSFDVSLSRAGILLAWGDNGEHQCEVPDGDDFVAVASGREHGLALCSDGSLAAWGRNYSGQCDVPDGNDFVAVVGGWFWSMALRSDGSLVAWGRNHYGQSDVPEGNDFTAIAAGEWHGLALAEDDSIAAWGRTLYGQCDVPDGIDFRSVAGGWHHSLALTSVPHLVEAMKDEKPEVRTSAAAALGAIGPEASSALPTLRRLLQDPNKQVSQAAVEALKRIEAHDTSPDSVDR